MNASGNGGIFLLEVGQLTLMYLNLRLITEFRNLPFDLASLNFSEIDKGAFR